MVTPINNQYLKTEQMLDTLKQAYGQKNNTAVYFLISDIEEMVSSFSDLKEKYESILTQHEK